MMKKNLVYILLSVFLVACGGGGGGGGDLGCTDCEEPTNPPVLTCTFNAASNFGESNQCVCPTGFLNSSDGFSCLADQSLEVNLIASQTDFNFGTQLVNENGSAKVVELQFTLTNTGTKDYINPINDLNEIIIGNSNVRLRAIEEVKSCRSREDLDSFQEARCSQTPTCDDNNLSELNQQRCDLIESCQRTDENPLSQEELIACGEQIIALGQLDDLPSIPAVRVKDSQENDCNNIPVGQSCTVTLNLDAFEVGTWTRNFSLNYEGDKNIDFSAAMTIQSIGVLTEATLGESALEENQELVGDYLKKISLTNIVHELFPQESFPSARRLEVSINNGTGGLFPFNPNLLILNGDQNLDIDLRNLKNVDFYVKSNTLQFNDGNETVELTVRVKDFEDNILLESPLSLDFERITNGNLFCWGSITQAYLNEFDPRLAAKVELGETTLADKVYVGNNRLCVDFNDNTAKCIGDNNFSQLATSVSFNDNTAEDIPIKSFNSVPDLNSAIIPSFNFIAPNDRHTCGLTDDNKIYCWGDNQNGVLGDGNFFFYDTSQENLSLAEERLRLTGTATISKILPDNLFNDDWKIVRSGTVPQSSEVPNFNPNDDTFATCAVTLDGKGISCWGFGDDEEVASPQRYLTVSANYTIEDFNFFDGGICYKNNLGRVYCGSFDPLLLNRGCSVDDDLLNFPLRCDLYPFTNPSDQFQLSNVIEVSGSGSNLFVIGDINLFENKIKETLLVPLRVGPFSSNTNIEVIANSGQLSNLNQISGDENSGIYLSDASGFIDIEVNIDEVSSASLNAREENSGLDNIYTLSDVIVKEMFLGQDHTCLQDNNDRLYCYGKNDKGQLGIGSSNDSLNPVMVLKRDDQPLLVDKVSLGDGYSCAIEKNSKEVFCWGFQGVSMPEFNDPANPENINPAISSELLNDKCIISNQENPSGVLRQCLLKPYPVEFNNEVLKADAIDLYNEDACIILSPTIE